MACFKIKSGPGAGRIFGSKDEVMEFLNRTPSLIEAKAALEAELGDVGAREAFDWVRQTIEDDTKNEQRVSSDLGIGESPIQTEPIEGGGPEKAETSGILQTQEEVTATPEEESASEQEFAAAVQQVAEVDPELSEEDADFAAALVQEGVDAQEAVEYVRSTPEEQREAPEVVAEEATEAPAAQTQEGETTKTQLEQAVEPAESPVKTEKNWTEQVSEIDRILELKGPEATAARREFREKYGKEEYEKAVKITRNFESIVKRLEDEGKIKKKCP